MKLRVEVIWALPARQRVVSVELEKGATAADAIEAAGIFARFAAIGSYGRKIRLETVLKDGDRVELLRPLLEDPKEARRRRARRR